MSDSSNTAPERGSNAWFCTTHWSVVLSAQGKDSRAGQALEALCRSYWYPLYAYARRLGQGPHDAEDSTQGFFVRLIEKSFLDAADQEKGRFRTFLLIAFKRFLANEWNKAHAQKRGGAQGMVPIDTTGAEARFSTQGDLVTQLQPDLLFDRQWALTLLDRVMTALQNEYAATDRAKLFAEINGYLVREKSAPPYATAAVALGLSEGAVKMAVQRMRIRYRELLRDEIADTVATKADADEEIRHLFACFAQ